MKTDNTYNGKGPQGSSDLVCPLIFSNQMRAAVSCSRPEVLFTRYEGKFYEARCTPLEINSQWEYCSAVAQHLARKSIEYKAGKRSHMDEPAIPDRNFERMVKTGWVLDPAEEV